MEISGWCSLEYSAVYIAVVYYYIQLNVFTFSVGVNFIVHLSQTTHYKTCGNPVV